MSKTTRRQSGGVGSLVPVDSSPKLRNGSTGPSPLKRVKTGKEEGDAWGCVSDEEMARRLHEQLNGPESPVASGRHIRTRKKPTFYQPAQPLEDGDRRGSAKTPKSPRELEDGSPEESDEEDPGSARRLPHERRVTRAGGSPACATPLKREDDEGDSEEETPAKVHGSKGRAHLDLHEERSATPEARQTRARKAQETAEAERQQQPRRTGRTSTAVKAEPGGSSSRGKPGHSSTQDEGSKEHSKEGPNGLPKLRKVRKEGRLDAPSDVASTSSDSQEGHPAENGQAPKRTGSTGAKKGSLGPRVPSKMPMVRHTNNHWYRARVLREDTKRVQIEFMGFENQLDALWLTKDSDRIWRGSYGGKAWRHVGDGAWEPRERPWGSKGQSRRKAGHSSSSSDALAQRRANLVVKPNEAQSRREKVPSRLQQANGAAGSGGGSDAAGTEAGQPRVGKPGLQTASSRTHAAGEAAGAGAAPAAAPAAEAAPDGAEAGEAAKQSEPHTLAAGDEREASPARQRRRGHPAKGSKAGTAEGTADADDSDGEEGTADAQPRGAAQVPPSTSQPAGEAAGGARGAAGLPAAEALPGSPRVSAAFGNAVDSAPAQHSTAAVAVAEPAAELQRAALPGRGRGRGDAGQPAAAAAAARRKLKRGGSGTNSVPRVTALDLAMEEVDAEDLQCDEDLADPDEPQPKRRGGGRGRVGGRGRWKGAKRQKVALAEPLVPTTRTSTRVRVPTKFEDAAKLTDSDGEEDAGAIDDLDSVLPKKRNWSGTLPARSEEDAAVARALAAVTAAELAAMPISPRLNGAARRKAHGRPSQQRRAAAAAAAAAALAQARATVQAQAQAAAAAEEELPAAAAPAQPAAPARASNPVAGGGMRRKATADRHLHREVSLGSDSVRSGRGISKSSSGSGSGLFGLHGKPGRFHFLLEALGRLNGTSPRSPSSAAAQGSSGPSVSKWFSPRGPQTPSILSVSPERFQTSMPPAPELLAPPLPLFT